MDCKYCTSVRPCRWDYVEAFAGLDEEAEDDVCGVGRDIELEVVGGSLLFQADPIGVPKLAGGDGQVLGLFSFCFCGWIVVGLCGEDGQDAIAVVGDRLWEGGMEASGIVVDVEVFGEGLENDRRLDSEERLVRVLFIQLETYEGVEQFAGSAAI